jgi:hypothetical protein
MWAGFLATAFVSMMQSDQISVMAYIPTAIVGIAGVFLLRKTEGAASSDITLVSSNLSVLTESMAVIRQRLSAMGDRRDSIDVYAIHGRIDAELGDELNRFAEAREAMIHGIGMMQYAEIMDHFARGERLINRAWSASADGYIDEAWRSIDSGASELGLAGDLLDSHMAKVSE